MDVTMYDVVNSTVVMAGLTTILLFVYACFSLWAKWDHVTGFFRLVYSVLLVSFPGVGPFIVLVLLHYEVGTLIRVFPRIASITSSAIHSESRSD
jgi:hypothetical protein